MPIKGSLTEGQLRRLLELNARRKKTVEILIQSLDGDEGRILMEHGEVIHASFGKQTGLNALRAMLTISSGSFSLSEQDGFPEAERNVEGPWEFLITGEEEQQLLTPEETDRPIFQSFNPEQRLVEQINDLVATQAVVLSRSGEVIGFRGISAEEAEKRQARLTMAANLSRRIADLLKSGRLKQLIVERSGQLDLRLQKGALELSVTLETHQAEHLSDTLRSIHELLEQVDAS